jgi:hypothetical protein
MNALSALLVALAQVAGQGIAGPLQQRPGLSAPSAAAAAQVKELAELSMIEASQDTAYLEKLRAALDSRDPFVRSNALATVSVAVSQLRTASAARAERLAQLKTAARPAVAAAVADSNGVIRRYAFMALVAVDKDSPASLSSTVSLAQRLFRSDSEPMVRAAAFDLLLSESDSRGRNWSLIEQAIADPAPAVKSAGFREAASAGAVEAIPYLVKGLNDETDQWTRLTAATALQAFVATNPEVVEAVADRVSREPNPYIREQMGHVLVQMRGKRQ